MLTNIIKEIKLKTKINVYVFSLIDKGMPKVLRIYCQNSIFETFQLKIGILKRPSKY